MDPLSAKALSCDYIERRAGNGTLAGSAIEIDRAGRAA